MSFVDLKLHTFNNIFSGAKTNLEKTLSLKKSLNYSNFTKYDLDLISNENKNPVFKDFKS